MAKKSKEKLKRARKA
jgi:hypothetical protein